jgi:hypothetical protein
VSDVVARAYLCLAARFAYPAPETVRGLRAPGMLQTSNTPLDMAPCASVS